MLAVQLHAAVVELSAGARARIKYSTVQNWYAGDEEGVGGIYNFVTKRGLCHGASSHISWTQARQHDTDVAARVLRWLTSACPLKWLVITSQSLRCGSCSFG